MILQYKGFNNNWCFEESETIVCADVFVGKETRDYRENGSRWKIHQEELKKCEDANKDNSLRLKYAQEMHMAVDELIKKETSCFDDIIYHIEGRFDEMENVCVVILNKPRAVTYVFNKTAYLLNNRGQTVKKLC